MKKGLVIIAVAAAAIAAYFLFFDKTGTNQTEMPKQLPLAQSANSDTFNMPFNVLLTAYFSLKEALINWDSAKATASADSLVTLASKVPYNSLKADTDIIATAKSLSESIIAEAQGIAGETTIEGQRHSFYTLSDALYNLIRTVHYDQQVIYHDKCPMAFGDDKEAYWISNTSQIINPYLGNRHPHYHGAMIGCGSVEDSIDFRKK